MRTFYAIIANGETEPEGLFYVEDDGTKLDIVGLNRRDKRWEPMPDLVGFFLGDGTDHAVEISGAEEFQLCLGWGCAAASPTAADNEVSSETS